MAEKSTSRNRSAAGYLLAAGLAMLISLGAAIVHGRLVERWGASEEVQRAAARLAETPTGTLGVWRMEESHELTPSVSELLQCRGYVFRTYVNGATGDVMTVIVMVGPAGPIAVHTPEICYSSQHYKQTSQRQREGFRSDDSLWSATFRSNRVDAESFAVYYAWSEGGEWQAARNPRWEFAGRPYLYKLQLAGSSSLLDADSGRAACRQFLEDFLPLIDDQLVSWSAQQALHQD